MSRKNVVGNKDFRGVSPKIEQKGHPVMTPDQRICCAEQRLRELTVKDAGFDYGKPTEPEWIDQRGRELLERATHQRLEWRDRDEINDLVVFLLKERGHFNSEKTQSFWPRFSAALSWGDIVYKFGLPPDNKSEMKIRGAYERVDRDIPGGRLYKPKRVSKGQQDVLRTALASLQCGLHVIVLEVPRRPATENRDNAHSPDRAE
jgi:hypothetical protein